MREIREMRILLRACADAWIICKTQQLVNVRLATYMAKVDVAKKAKQLR
jgi:hypothetical protein